MRIRGEFLVGVLVGAGLMYLLDPEGGAGRRSLIADRAGHLGSEAGGRVGGRARDLRNRSRGLLANARGRLRSEDVSDDVLEARVRSELGHAIDHAGSITVVAQDGRVMLGGAVVERDLERVLETVRRVRGVKSVDNQLQPR